MDAIMTAVESVGAGLISRPTINEGMEVVGAYHAECYGADGTLKWSEEFPNLVTNVGKNFMLDNALNTSATSATNVYMGLKGSGTAAAGDTMASHSGWSELNITANRATPSFSSASGGSKTTSSAASFSITAAGPTTVAGVLIVLGSTATTSNTSTAGTLFSAGDFSASRSVVSGDTLNVTYTVSV